MLALRRGTETEQPQAEEGLLLFKLNDNYDLVDALAYVDGFTDELKDEVKELITLEMTTFQPHNYLAALQPPRTPCLDAAYGSSKKSESDGDTAMEEKAEGFQYLWQKEIQRLQTKSGPFQKLDMSRYDAPEPADEQDASAWKASLKNIKAQVENSSTRIINLDLALQYAQPAWLKHLEELESHEKLAKKRVTEVAAEIEKLNKRRKLDQITGGNELRALLREYEDVFDRNLVILPVINDLRDEVGRLDSSN